MSINFELSLEEEFAVYATILRLFRDRAHKDKRELEITKEIHNRLYGKIYKYIDQCVYKRCYFQKNSSNTVDDYVGSAWEEVLNNFYKYNGCNKLTTFVKCYIEAGLRRQNEYAYGNLYYRTMYSRAMSEGVSNTSDKMISALSVANPGCLDDLSGNELFTDSVEDVVIKECEDQAICELLNALNSYERRAILLHSGIIRGKFDRKYSMTMICADSELVDMVEPEFPQWISCDNFKYRRFSESVDTYILVSEPVKHIIPSFVSKIIRDAKKKIRHNLCG